MIVGNGLIAEAINKHFFEHENTIFFASGVSDSAMVSKREFDREEMMLKSYLEQNHDSLFVYFSSCSIYDKETPYSRHKSRMESLVRTYRSKYLIFRLSQVVGSGGNPNNLFNYLSESVLGKKELTIWEGAKRNFIDVDDVIKIVKEIITNNKYSNVDVNVASPYNIEVSDIVELIARYYCVEIEYTKGRRVESYSINIDCIKTIAEDLNVFPAEFEEYLNLLLVKYGRS